ncbi:MAG: hypothetical protein IJL58_05195 [Bacteroidales bacterium]|nr:hypothetical protein [Bacteroidales bacterium]
MIKEDKIVRGKDLVTIGDAIKEKLNNLTVIAYPVFSIDNNMHLVISSPEEEALDLFSIDNNGNLIMSV